MEVVVVAGGTAAVRDGERTGIFACHGRQDARRLQFSNRLVSFTETYSRIAVNIEKRRIAEYTIISERQRTAGFDIGRTVVIVVAVGECQLCARNRQTARAGTSLRVVVVIRYLERQFSAGRNDEIAHDFQILMRERRA